MAEAALSCPVCASTRCEVLARPRPWTYLRCRSCATHFVDPMPAGDAVDDADVTYADAYYSAEAREQESLFERATEASAAARIAAIERALGRQGRLLDVGCGTGYLLAAARDRGWHVQGVEVAEAAAAYARDRLDVPVFTGTLAAAGFPDRSFDAVTMVHVLEHVPDPLALLRETRRLLDPHGVLSLAIPNPSGLVYSAYNLVHRARGRYRRDRYSCSLLPPWHLYAWDASALRALLGREGLRLEQLEITGKGDPARYPMVSWKGAGRFPTAQRIVEAVGRRIGRGSLIEALARPS